MPPRLDTRIPLAARPGPPIQQPDMGQTLSTIARFKGAKQQQQLRGLQIEAAQADAADRPGRMEHQGKLRDLALQKAETGVSYDELRLAKEQNEMVLGVLSAVKDQRSYDQGQQYLEVKGLSLKEYQLPRVYDPALIERFKQEALGVQGRLNQMWKEKESERQKFKDIEARTERQIRSEERREDKAATAKYRQDVLGLKRQGLEQKDTAEATEKSEKAMGHIGRLRELERKIMAGEPVGTTEGYLMMLGEIRKGNGREQTKDLTDTSSANANEAQQAKLRSLETIRAAIRHWLQFAPEDFRQPAAGSAGYTSRRIR